MTRSMEIIYESMAAAGTLSCEVPLEQSLAGAASAKSKQALAPRDPRG